jgi:hypothetical protein
MRKWPLLLAAFLFLFMADSALAQGEGMKAQGIYIGGAVGGGFLKTDDGFFDDASVAWKGMLGFRTKFFALETDYRHLGSITGALSGVKSKTKGFQASGLLMIPVGPVDLYGRGGAFFWKNTITAGSLDTEIDGTDFAWGGGVALRLGSFSLRAEYERAEIEELDKPWIATLGMTIAF